MTRSPSPARLYRKFVRLYPRRFREEYGADMVQLVADQLRDEPAWRVAARSAVDLTLTIPARHLEAHMDRTPTTIVPIVFGTIALSAVVVGVVVGHPVVALVCLAVAITAATLGVLAAARARPLTEPRSLSVHWWKLIVCGVGLLGALIAITTATGELPDGAWFIAMVTGLTAILLLAAGILLGIVHIASRTQRHPAA